MWNNKKDEKIIQSEKFTRDRKVIDMRSWLEQKREAAKNVLTFTPRSFSPNDPPSVA